MQSNVICLRLTFLMNIKKMKPFIPIEKSLSVNFFVYKHLPTSLTYFNYPFDITIHTFIHT